MTVNMFENLSDLMLSTLNLGQELDEDPVIPSKEPVNSEDSSNESSEEEVRHVYEQFFSSFHLKFYIITFWKIE